MHITQINAHPNNQNPKYGFSNSRGLVFVSFFFSLTSLLRFWK